MIDYVLDTDTFSLFRKGQVDVTRRVLASDPSRLAVTVITVDEALSGWQAAIRRPLPPAVLADKYSQLASAVMSLRRFHIETFSVPAILDFEQLRKAKLNVGSNDLRIAAIARTLQATVVTRNLRDFRRVPNLVCEDRSNPLAGPPAGV
jgi:tRNA(fMet)-specific endonuclease VapC